MQDAPEFGGMKVVNIEQKLNAFHLIHLKNLILGTEARWHHLAKYFIGFHLRHFNSSLYLRSRPHQIEFIPKFYECCLKALTLLVRVCPNPGWQTITCATAYKLLLKNLKPDLVISRHFPAINFTTVFKEVHNNFVDPIYRELNWKIVHNILPTKALLNKWNIIRSNTCPLCSNSPELLDHLFLSCPKIQALLRYVKDILGKIYQNPIMFNRQQMLFMMDLPQQYKDTYLFIMSIYKYSIWIFRNKVVFEKYTLQSNAMIQYFRSKLVQRINVDFYRLKNNVADKWPQGIALLQNNKKVIVNF